MFNWKPKVLVVDDTPFIREFISSTVRESGLNVVGVAESGKDAIKKAKELEPDLIIMDCVMPELDGISSMKTIRNNGISSKFIICATNNQHKIEAKVNGANGFIRKPMSLQDIKEEISKVLRQGTGGLIAN